ncbi:MAG: hypothetical protein MJZ34_02895 [Paludibacteraceae bacterium]|nr:hypothetical protein [Paludibacteraceae bacterium]
MTFSDILSYQTDMEASMNEAAEFITLIKDIILPLQHGSEVLLYDAIPVIAVRIYNSTSESLTDFIRIKYECPIHHEKESLEVHLSNFNFEDMNKTFRRIKSVRLGQKDFDIIMPTVKDFLDVTDSFRLRVPVENALKYFYLLSLFKASYEDKNKLEILNAIKNATSKDIKTLNMLYEMITGAFTGFNAKCIHGKEPVTVRLSTIKPVTDIFQNILESEEFDEATFDLRKDD